MTARHVSIGGLVVYLLFSATSPFSQTPCAQSAASCAQQLNQQEAALNQFGTDLPRDVNGFIRADVGNTIMRGLKSDLAGDPTADAVEAAKAKYEEWKEWVQQTKLTKDVLAQLSECIGRGGKGCMDKIKADLDRSTQLLKESSDAWAEATKKWIDSLGNESVSAAAERVDNARNIVERYSARAGTNFTNAATGGINNCLRNFEQRAQASPRNPVDLRAASQPQPPVQPPAPEQSGGGNGNGSGSSGGSGGGMGAGTIVGYTAAGAGAIVGAKMLSDYSKQVKCNQYETEANAKVNTVVNAANNLALCQTVSCANQRKPAVDNAVSSLMQTLGSWCTCLGPNATSEISAQDRAAVRDALNGLRQLGVNPGTFPACFR